MTKGQGKGSGPRKPVAAADAAGELDELWRGLNRSQREIASRYFYDRRGSELFVEITRLPEYYPTRTELGILESRSREIVDACRPAAVLELGAGSATKTRLLLDALEERGDGGAYLPLDVSAEFLASTAQELRREYPDLEVAPLVGDLTDPIAPDVELPRPLLLLLLGSTIGNFDDGEAVSVLRNAAAALQDGDHFLMGADLRPSPGKSLAELEAAYDDTRGVTAAFNLNALSVVNDRFGTDFDLTRFRHRAFYDSTHGRIEMHLVARSDQTITVPGKGLVRLRGGETIRTEISCKYDRPTVQRLFRDAGLELVDWITDEQQRYALAVGCLS